MLNRLCPATENVPMIRTRISRTMTATNTGMTLVRVALLTTAKEALAGLTSAFASFLIVLGVVMLAFPSDDLEVGEACRRLREALGNGHPIELGETLEGHSNSLVLAGAMQAVLQQLRAQGGTVYDGEALIALQAIERGAESLAIPGAPRVYIDLVGRLLPKTRGDISVSGITP